MSNYYEILELQQTATSEDIRKAYRKLALRWHPDKNPNNLEEANKRFREICEAYEVLIDERRRRLYHQFGAEWRSHVQGGQNPFFPEIFMFRNPEEVFQEFFRPTSVHNLTSNLNRLGIRPGPNMQTQPGGINSICTPFLSPIGVPPRFGFLPFNNILQGPPRNLALINERLGGPGGVSVVRQTSITTQFINGKKITVKKIFEQGRLTTILYENDVIKSRTVNGVPQPLMYV